jgi:hypothetical protein
MTFDGDDRIPDPRGDLVPPPRHPPTAVGAGTPSPEPRRTNVVRAEAARTAPLVELLGHALTLALDALDAAGDAVAERLGIRHAADDRAAPPPPPA